MIGGLTIDALLTASSTKLFSSSRIPTFPYPNRRIRFHLAMANTIRPLSRWPRVDREISLEYGESMARDPVTALCGGPGYIGAISPAARRRRPACSSRHGNAINSQREHQQRILVGHGLDDPDRDQVHHILLGRHRSRPMIRICSSTPLSASSCHSYGAVEQVHRRLALVGSPFVHPGPLGLMPWSVQYVVLGYQGPPRPSRSHNRTGPVVDVTDRSDDFPARPRRARSIAQGGEKGDGERCHRGARRWARFTFAFTRRPGC